MKKQNTHLLPSLMASAYIIFFTFVCFLKFDSLSYKDADLAMFIQTFRNTLDGIILPASHGNGVVLSGSHFPLVAFILSPAYALFPSPYTLLFLQSLFLGLGAWIVYLIADNILGRDFALYFCFAYLVYPAVNYINLFEAHFIAFSTPLLLLMFYFFIKRNFILFLVCMFLSLLCQEDVALVVIGFGIYALLGFLRKKENLTLKWPIASLLSGCAWVVLTLILTAYTHKNAQLFKDTPVTQKNAFSYMGFYSWLGNSPQEMLAALLTRPLYVLKNIFMPYKIEYMFELFAPLVFSSFLSLSGMVIVFFGLSETLLSNWPNHNRIYFQHSAPVIPFIFISSILGLNKVIPKAVRLRKALLIAFYCSSIFSALRTGPIIQFSKAIPAMQKVKSSTDVSLKKAFIKQVPKKAALITTFELSTHMADRNFLYFFYMFTYDKLNKIIPDLREKYDYALVDFNDYLTFHPVFYTLRNNLGQRCFILQEGWGVVETMNSLAIFKKGHKSNYKLIETAGFLDGSERKKLNGNYDIINYDIGILGETYKYVSSLSFEALEVEFKVIKLRNQAYDYLSVVQLQNNKGELFNQPLIAPFRIYPYSEWKENEIVMIRSKILLPDGFRQADIKPRLIFIKQNAKRGQAAFLLSSFLLKKSSLSIFL